MHEGRRSSLAALSVAAVIAICGVAAGVAQERPIGPAAQPPAGTPTPGAARTAETAPPSQKPTAEKRSPGEQRIECNTKPTDATAGGASITQQASNTVQHKAWQPTGGDLVFTVASFQSIPPSAQVIVCYRWAQMPDPDGGYIERRPTQIDLSSDGKVLKVGTIVPYELANMPRPNGVYSLYIVPLAEVRIMVIDQANNRAVVDVITAIGVTRVGWALLLVGILAVLAFLALYLVCRKRLHRAGVSSVNLFLCVISTPNGYASLSQLQILVWTFLVGASAVYVMALSGELIQITTGTLVLLGISGAATVGSKVYSESQEPPGVPPPYHPRPLWSDLIVNEIKGSDGLIHREIDVTRVQMLYFTLITASFVIIKVLTIFVIPEIPEGFQILMGISNAVYMGSKVSQKQPTPQPASP